MLLIDAIGPFFRHYKTKRVNWSKTPFSELETQDGLKKNILQTAPLDFEEFCKKIRAIGYTGVTLDDVAHLVTSQAYPEKLNQKIVAYQKLYRQLFEIAKRLDLQIFITTDVAYQWVGDRSFRKKDVAGSSQHLGTDFDRLLSDFPQIDGIITRFGESDGLDVEGDFRSQLVLKKASHVRTFLRQVLPVFEKHGRLLIFRTWSVGAYPIGDLMWNQRTFDCVFKEISSPAMIISMKYGESDFFRYLPTNPMFFKTDQKVLVEFQARREYEGFGAYPSFVGYDAEVHFARLRVLPNLVGASVWCQTGGWGKLRQLTFLRNSSPWVELNVFVLAKLHTGMSCRGALEEYCDNSWPGVETDALERFLRLSDQAIENLLYVREFAERRLFFRRLRLPPQLFVFWDRILVDKNIKKILGCLISDPKRVLRESEEGLDQLREMIALSRESGISSKGLNFQLQTFELIAEARLYYFGDDDQQAKDQQAKERLATLNKYYKASFKRHYSMQIKLDETRLNSRLIRWGIAILLRRNSSYRWIDQVITLRALSWGYFLLKAIGKRNIGPKFANKQAMGIEALFK